MADAKIQVQVDGDSSGAQRAFQQLDSESTKAFEGMRASTVAWGAAIGVLAVKGVELAGRAIRGLVSEAQDWIKSSNEQENAIVAMNAALQASGIFTEALSQRYQDLSAAFQEVSTVADEKVLGGMQRFVKIDRDQYRQMKRAMHAAP